MSALGEAWYPIRIFRDDGAWWVDWCRFDDLAFREPFYHQTVMRALERPFNQALRRVTPLAMLRDVADDARARNATLAPDGFVFHLSRCGSTLISQAFAALEDCIAISEVGPLDEILRATRHDASVDDAWRARHLRDLIAVFGRNRFGERRYAIKLDAWHVYDIELLEQTFPDVPWVFVARDPIEVMVSHAREPGWIMSAVNAPTLAGLGAPEAMRTPTADYHARALGRMLEVMVRYQSSRGLAVDYVEMPGAIVERIAPHFGFSLDDTDRARIARALERDAKRPERSFVSDRAEKHAAATQAIRDAAERFANEPYRRWNRVRRESLDVVT
jgi:hypothetical protein